MAFWRGVDYFFSILLILLPLSLLVQNVNAQNISGQVMPWNPQAVLECANLVRDGYFVDAYGKIYDQGATLLNTNCQDVFNGNADPNILKSTENNLHQPAVQQIPPSSENWLGTCKNVEWGLMNRCDVYVNPDGSLSAEGRCAYQCISNGGLLSAAGLIMSLPPNIIIGILEPLSERTNCGNIVNWVLLKTVSNPMDFLNQLKK